MLRYAQFAHKEKLYILFYNLEKWNTLKMRAHCIRLCSEISNKILHEIVLVLKNRNLPGQDSCSHREHPVELSALSTCSHFEFRWLSLQLTSSCKAGTSSISLWACSLNIFLRAETRVISSICDCNIRKPIKTKQIHLRYYICSYSFSNTAVNILMFI